MAQRTRDYEHVKDVQEARNLCKGTVWEARRRAVLIRDHWVCWICGQSIDPTISGRQSKGPSVDHIRVQVEQVVGRQRWEARQLLFDIDNMKAAHYGCNVRRSNSERQAIAKAVITGQPVEASAPGNNFHSSPHAPGKYFVFPNGKALCSSHMRELMGWLHESEMTVAEARELYPEIMDEIKRYHESLRTRSAA